MSFMRDRSFHQVDVFTGTALRGNPLAVVLDGEGLSDAAMQAFAAWAQLSETTFVLPPTEHGRAAGADYRVRIFTPGGELPFAGHPTLGTAFAWVQAGGQPLRPDRIVQECGVGLVRLREQGGYRAFAAPELRRRSVDTEQLAAVSAALGLRPDAVQAAQQLDNGPHWLGLLLADPATVRSLAPDHAMLKRIGVKVGVAARYEEPDGRGPALEVRAFAAPVGILEDPVTGSLNASLAQWLIAQDRMPAVYRARQGLALGRAGEVLIDQDSEGQVWVGGQVAACIRGIVRL
jgi:PhzF family phenazine biosynthesis protein